MSERLTQELGKREVVIKGFSDILKASEEENPYCNKTDELEEAVHCINEAIEYLEAYLDA